MKVEIIAPTGYGSGTRVYVDGQTMTGIRHLKLEIPAEGLIELTITRHLMDGDRPLLVEPSGGDRELATEVLRFVGLLELDKTEVRRD